MPKSTPLPPIPWGLFRLLACIIKRRVLRNNARCRALKLAQSSKQAFRLSPNSLKYTRNAPQAMHTLMSPALGRVGAHSGLAISSSRSVLVSVSCPQQGLMRMGRLPWSIVTVSYRPHRRTLNRCPHLVPQSPTRHKRLLLIERVNKELHRFGVLIRPRQNSRRMNRQRIQTLIHRLPPVRTLPQMLPHQDPNLKRQLLDPRLP